MRPSNSCVLGISIVLLATLAPGEASARGRGRGIPIPIVFGQGEELAHVGELPDEVRALVRSEVGADVSIGFFYKRFHVFWLSFWTWDGRHVLYDGDQYWEPAPADWDQLLGAPARRSLGTPFFYRFPIGLGLIGGLVVLGFLGSRAFPSDQERARKLLVDPRYQEALNLYLGRVSSGYNPAATGSAGPTSPEAAFENAVQLLRDRGIPADRAENDLQVILRALAQERRGSNAS